jgi:MFS family permease
VCFGLVSLFADMTYEGAHSLVGPFLQDLGAGAAVVGLVAGFGEMVAAGLRYFSGKLADRTQAYWTITICGYALNVIVVPALAFVGSWQAAALLIIVERTGKALRGPARDVLLSEATATVGHGFGFGLHTAMDQTGAVLGPLLMAGVVAETHDMGPAFLTLGIPAVLAVLALFVARWARPVHGSARPAPSMEIPRVFWTYVAAAGLLACGFLDFPLMAYHFQHTQLFAPEVIPLLYAGAMATVGISALVYGRFYDLYGIRVLAFGIGVSLCALPLAFFGGTTGAIAGIICWGAGLGVQDASLRAGIAQVVSMNKRGTAFGAFNGVYGIAWFAGSAVMGLMYDRSLLALVAFGVAMQMAAAVMFFRLRAPLAAAGNGHRVTGHG